MPTFAVQKPLFINSDPYIREELSQICIVTPVILLIFTLDSPLSIDCIFLGLFRGSSSCLRYSSKLVPIDPLKLFWILFPNVKSLFQKSCLRKFSSLFFWLPPVDLDLYPSMIQHS